MGALLPLRFQPRVRLATIAFLGLAAVIGLVTGVNPAIGLGLAVALAFALAMTWDLTVGVCGFVLLSLLDVVGSNQDLSLTKAAGAFLVLAWIAAAATQRGPKRSLTGAQPWLAAILIAFITWSTLSAIWAESTSAAYRSSFRFALDAMLFPIVFLAVRERKHVVWILMVFVIGVELSALYGLLVGPTGDSVVTARDAAAGRLTGARGDSNVLATLLMVATLFCGALFVTLRRVPLAAPLSLAGAVLGLVGLFATFSRGGILSLVVVLLVGLVYGGRWRKGLAALGLVAAVVGAFYVASALSGGDAARLLNSSSTGRTSIWTLGWRMVTAHPVVGVGSGNYTVTEPHYLLTSPGLIDTGQVVVDTPQVAHNIYLHVLAEMGAIGLVLFMGVLILSIASAVRAVKIFRARNERGLEVLGRALVMALIGILASDFFVSDQYSKQLWMLLALGPALLAIATRAEPRPESTPAALRPAPAR